MPQFVCGGTAKRLPPVAAGDGKVVVRVNNADPTAKVFFKSDSVTLVTEANADGYLMAGESIEISGNSVDKISDVSFIDKSDNPIIFFGVV